MVGERALVSVWECRGVVSGEVDERQGVNSSEQLAEMQSQLQQESVLLRAHNATLASLPCHRGPL
eukprot:COSAG02_NODE_1082_length_14704_cov_49.941664_12_plen_65_part_00